MTGSEQQTERLAKKLYLTAMGENYSAVELAGDRAWETRPENVKDGWLAEARCFLAPQDGKVEAGERPLDEAENVEEFVRNVTAWENGDDESDLGEAIKDAETVTAFLAAPPSQVGQGLSDEDRQALLRAAIVCSNPHNWVAQPNVAGRLRKLAASPPVLLEKLEAEVARLRNAVWAFGLTVNESCADAADRLQAILDSEGSGSE